MRLGAVSGLMMMVCAGSPALAAQCPGNPDALGTSRELVIDPSEHVRLGTMQYQETLPLADREVVLTFDDGPLPQYSARVLDTLASECVKATYFLVGRMARAYPDMVRRIRDAGHTVGTHSQNHPLTFHKMPLERAEQEIEQGIESVGAALGDVKQVAPFFRIPGLLRVNQVEQYLASRTLMTWSADFPADDWRHISASEVMKRALDRLEAKGKGVLLLHDIQPATVVALPGLLRELKQRGYRIVHVVPSSPDRPKTPTVASQWLMKPPRVADAVTSADWPLPANFAVSAAPPALPVPSPRSFGLRLAGGPAPTIDLPSELGRTAQRPRLGAVHPVWRVFPQMAGRQVQLTALLPAPSPASFGLGDLTRTMSAQSWPAPERRTSVQLDKTTTGSAPTDITGSLRASTKAWPVVRSNVPNTAYP